MCTIFLNLLCVLLLNSDRDIEIKVVDEKDNPIEGVYVKCHNNFWHTNDKGVFRVEKDLIGRGDSIFLSHLGYKREGIVLNALSASQSSHTIRLEYNVRVLDEVNVPTFDPKKYVERAIKKIPLLYSDAYHENLSIDADITFGRSDQGSEEDLIKYKGMLHLSVEEKDRCIAREPESEFVSPNLKENIFFNRPYYMLTMLSIRDHHVVRQYKKYDFISYEFVDYKGVNAVKINFKEKNNKGHRGFLIIDKDTQAILSLNYSRERVNTWIFGTMKGKGFVTTSLNMYYVESDYTPDECGKYLFDSGRSLLESNTRWKKKSVSTLSNVYFKRNNDGNKQSGSADKKKIKELFM